MGCKGGPGSWYDADAFDDCCDDDGCACEMTSGFSTDTTPPHSHYCGTCGPWIHTEGDCVGPKLEDGFIASTFDCPDCVVGR